MTGREIAEWVVIQLIRTVVGTMALAGIATAVLGAMALHEAFGAKALWILALLFGCWLIGYMALPKEGI